MKANVIKIEMRCACGMTIAQEHEIVDRKVERIRKSRITRLENAVDWRVESVHSFKELIAEYKHLIVIYRSEAALFKHKAKVWNLKIAELEKEIRWCERHMANQKERVRKRLRILATLKTSA